MRFGLRGLFLLTALVGVSAWLAASGILVREVLLLSLIAMGCLAAFGLVRLVRTVYSRFANARRGE